MGTKPTPSLDDQTGPGGESTPLVRPYRRRHFRETPDGLVPYLPEGDPRHGTRHGYNGCGCNCESCTQAKADAQADYRARRRAMDQAGAA